ncbi:Fur family transcriptional regulator [Candidatus Hodarchaeum mangrovi]
MTNQRVAIGEFLEDNLNHPTADEIYKAVKTKLPRITKATVYKNLKVLLAEGLIKEVNVKGITRFEAKIDPHHHIICKNCTKIIDFASQELTDFALQVIRDQKNFKIQLTETIFYGICKNCES